MDAEIIPTDHDADRGSDKTQCHTGRKWLIRISVTSVLMLFLFTATLPTIVTVCGLQNAILAGATSDQELSASAKSASLAWFTPVTFRDVDVKRDDKSWAVSTPTFSTDKSLLDLLLGLPDIGSITLDRPVVVLQPVATPQTTDEDDEHPESSATYPPMKAIVRDGSVEIRLPNDPEPVISVDGISFVARTETISGTSLLIVEPVKLFDRRKLTPELCDQGLQLIAPILSEAAVVTGELTVELDGFQMPIGTITQAERVHLTKISGRLMLHKVETGLKNPLLAEIASVLSMMSGGKFATVRASEETQVIFRVEHGRVHHEGLTLLIPELSRDLTITTSGWVDIEENIDIRILANLSGLIPSRIGILTDLTQAPLELHMTGTLTNPHVSLPGGRNILDELAGRLTGGDTTRSSGENRNLTGAITDLVGGLVGDSNSKPDMKKATRGIFDLIRTFQNDSKAGPQK
ncbi:MAG: hypothetical protein O3B13_14670 [Planctomycetota bacterium]|nr:hypothetical protein [Planctomycetota bacterium]MDA1164336.1 hypothetical protein [Planctomycetota bacterium]